MERELGGFVSVFVLDVEHSLLGVKSSVVIFECCLVEGFWLVKTVTIGSSNLVSVLVGLGAPARSVPVLSVFTVTTGELIQGFLLKVGVLSEA